MNDITKNITPLPWFYGKTDIGPYDWSISDCPIEDHRITLGSSFICSINANCTPERTEANARYLCAVANNMPAILESLRTCLAIVRIQNGNLHPETNKLQNETNAAIQKLFNDMGLTYEWDRL